ncbi:MAG: GtrA family protein [Ruminococcus sp.]|nr:GtrA family protein [Ruminococcus sp.]
MERIIRIMTKKMLRKLAAALPEPLGGRINRFEDIIIYVFYGVLTTLVNYTVHFGIRLAFADLGGADTESVTGLIDAMRDSRISSAAAATAAWLAALIFAFFTNKFFVFESRETSAKAYAREFTAFAGGRLFSYGCELAAMFFFVDVMSFNEPAVKLLCGIFVIALNYLFSKLLVFKKKHGDDRRRRPM